MPQHRICVDPWTDICDAPQQRNCPAQPQHQSPETLCQTLQFTERQNVG